ncbi:hypothetical protein OIV83_002511 [Microbotryomycetes sp. JL201]|nr:hypothetical protein OIV83_002511 [Microbotryomycetes sp. JL201]
MSSASRQSTPGASTDSDTASQSPANTPLDADEVAHRLQLLDKILSDTLLGRPSDSLTPTLCRSDTALVKDDSVNAAFPAQIRYTASLRLFSTQTEPQAVVILTAEQEWPVVPDTRIRDVTDEDPAHVDQRKAEIATVAVDGHLLRAHATTHAATPNPSLVQHRALVASQMRQVATLPRLAFLDAVFSVPRHSRKNHVTPKNDEQKTRRHIEQDLFPKSKRKRVNKRHPLKSLRNVLLRASPAATPSQAMPQAQTIASTTIQTKSQNQAISVQERRQNLLLKLKRAVVNPVETADDQTSSKPRGNKRLSKKRRDELKLKLKKVMGKNSKKNQRKKAKLKAKAA